jgi:putative ATPase
VPKKLRNAVTSLMRDEGYGAGYRSPHASPEGVVIGERYLPDELGDVVLYQPAHRGEEESVQRQLDELRAARKTR